MVYSPGIFPVMSKLVRKVCFRVIMSLTSAVVRWSWERGYDLHFPEKGLQVTCGLAKGLLMFPKRGDRYS